MKFRIKYLFLYLFRIKKVNPKILAFYREELEAGTDKRDLTYVTRAYPTSILKNMNKLLDNMKRLKEKNLEDPRVKKLLDKHEEFMKKLINMADGLHEYKPFLLKYNLFIDTGIRPILTTDELDLVPITKNLDNQITSNVASKKFNL